jgi:hypothetical protein
MSLSTTETIGLSSQLGQVFQDNITELKTKGLDVSEWITHMNNLRDNAVTEDTKLDDMRADIKTQTKVSKDATTLLYKTSSTYLDAVIGVLGKDTPLAKQAARLRSGLIKQSKSKSKNKKTKENTET